MKEDKTLYGKPYQDKSTSRLIAVRCSFKRIVNKLLHKHEFNYREYLGGLAFRKCKTCGKVERLDFYVGKWWSDERTSDSYDLYDRYFKHELKIDI